MLQLYAVFPGLNNTAYKGMIKVFAFVIMPFPLSFNSVYQRIVKPAGESYGIECVRIAGDSRGYIHSQMLKRIHVMHECFYKVQNITAIILRTDIPGHSRRISLCP